LARFPSKEWCEAAVQRVNSDPETTAAGKGWVGDFGAVVDPEPGMLDKPFTVHFEPENGLVKRWRVLPDPDDLEEIEPKYLARAPYSVWKALLLGTLDPIDAVLQKRIKLKGDLQQLVERMKYKGIADRVLGQIPTEFPDGGGG
jgi:putative sterol carrier protein